MHFNGNRNCEHNFFHGQTATENRHHGTSIFMLQLQLQLQLHTVTQVKIVTTVIVTTSDE